MLITMVKTLCRKKIVFQIINDVMNLEKNSKMQSHIGCELLEYGKKKLHDEEQLNLDQHSK